MPKGSCYPEYSNTQIKSLIMEYCHDKTDRKMLYYRLVDGDTISEIAEKVGLSGGYSGGYSGRYPMMPYYSGEYEGRW